VVDRRWILEFCRLLTAERLPITWRLPSGRAPKRSTRKCSPRWWRAAVRRSSTRRRAARRDAGAHQEAGEAGAHAALDAGRGARRMHVRAHFIMGMRGRRCRRSVRPFAFIGRMAWVGVHDVMSYFFYRTRAASCTGSWSNRGRSTQRRRVRRVARRRLLHRFQGIRSWSDEFSPGMLRLLCLGSMAWFYALSFLFWPFRALRTPWRVLRGRPFTWLERFSTPASSSTCCAEGLAGHASRRRSRHAAGGSAARGPPAASGQNAPIRFVDALLTRSAARSPYVGSSVKHGTRAARAPSAARDRVSPRRSRPPS